MQVYQTQKECGDSILKSFQDDSTLAHVLLLAQMQMGKSGTYWYVIFHMLFSDIYNIENVIIMSGNREIDLYQQVKKDRITYTDWFIEQKTSLTKKDKKNMRKKALSQIQIIWGPGLAKADAIVKPNTLIVWDESHYAQSENNTPDKFFKRNNLENLVNGTESCLDERNIRLLTVSATPFSELITSRDSHHKLIRLEPGETYCGIETYCKKKAFKSSFEVKEETKDDMRSILKQYSDTNNYMIVRVSDNKQSVHIIRELCEELFIDLKLYNSQKKDIMMSDLQEKPEKATVILISGMLRMGKVVPKDHISMVFEAATKNKKRQSDTGLQGLIGRMCGYTNKPNGFDVKLYVEETIIDQIHEYLDQYHSDTGPILCNAMNVRMFKPHKKSMIAYHLVKIPYLPQFLTRKNNPRKKSVKNWISNETNLANIETETPEVKDHLKKLLDISMKFTGKNADLTVNNGIRNMIDKSNDQCDRVGYSYKTIEENTVTVVSYPTTDTMWLVFPNKQQDMIQIEEEDSDEESDNSHENGSIYVLDKCVFKA